MPEEPTLPEVISEVGEGIPKKEKPVFFEILKTESEKEETLAEREKRRIIEMRDDWSPRILLLIELIVVFDFMVVLFYGWGWLKFNDTRVVMMVVTENFLKVIGLGFLITQSIFTRIYK